MFKPLYSISNKLVSILENIAALKNMIENSSKQLKWLPKLNKEALIKTIHSSTAIEGNPLNEKEVELVISGSSIGYQSKRAEQEIINYLEALKFMEKYSEIKSITEKDVLKLHSIIGNKNALDRGPFGEYRNYSVRVGKHIAPLDKVVPFKVKELLKWLDKEGSQTSPIISSAILHYQFETIHPFGDGNGRVGRLLSLWELYKRGFDKHHIFAIDEYYLENQQQYYDELEAVQLNQRDLSKWIEFVAEGINFTLEKTIQRINATGKDSQSGERLVLTPKQERILNMLRLGDMSTTDIRIKAGLSRQGVWFIMKPLIDKNIVEKVGGKKTGKYRLI